MNAQDNARPIIIKRKKIVGGGHHGGAWKVAYADFVTAMMAFFMLMWLLNATTEQQRKGIADYFTPTIPINRVSGGGNGAFGGDSIFTEQTMPRNGTGATSPQEARGDVGTDGDPAPGDAETLEETNRFRAADAALQGMGGESAVMENALKHVVTRVTDEGLVVEVFELEQTRLFEPETARPTQLLRDLATVIARTSDTITNPVAIGGHVHSRPVVLANSPVWDLSTARAATMRGLLQEAGIAAPRVHRTTGHADRSPVVADPMAVRNNRLEVVFLRRVPRN